MAWPTNADIATRLARTLTTAEEEQADLLLEQAIAAVADACGKDDDWSAALTPIPAALAGIVIEVVARAISAPVGVRSQSLGQWSESYPDQLAQGLQLTPAEERRARRIVFGSNSGSATLPSVLDDLFDLTS
jgi:hypothetical protein